VIPGIIAALLPLVPDIVKGVEALFQSKPKSGEDKMSAATQALRGVATQMVSSQLTLPDGTKAAQPTDDALTGMIETVFQQLKTSGSLTGPAAAGNLYLVQGTITQLKAQ